MLLIFSALTRGVVSDYARAERCIDVMEGSKFVPSYITYMTERAMENIELLDN